MKQSQFIFFADVQHFNMKHPLCHNEVSIISM